MKRIILLLFVIASGFTAEAKKMIFPIEVVAGSADLIVVGEISAVQSNSYSFRISETLKGNGYKVITVNMFKEWTCDTRFGKPVVGQKLCLFLKKETSSWEIINGSTGELLISKNSMALDGYGEVKPDFTFIPYSLSLTEFKNGIKEFCRCYKFVGTYGFTDKKAHFEKIDSAKAISDFKNRSRFTSWLFEKMTYYFNK